MFWQPRRRVFSPATATFGWWLAIVCVSAPAGAGQEDGLDTRPPTTVEQALAEHVCGAMPSSSPDDVHEPCIHAQFRALRSEFGYDLGRLSAAERSQLDATCSRLRKPESIEPYFNCLTAWLIAVRESRPQANSTSSEVFGVVSAYGPTNAPPPSSHRFMIVFVSVLGGMLGGVGVAVAALRLKKNLARVEPTCQRCGAVLQAAGSLCPPCRHEMGVAAKQAIADRAAEKRAEEERRRHEQEQAEERQRLAEEQAVQQQLLEKARWRAEHDERAREKVASPDSPPAPAAPIGAADDDFVETDPFKVLGVTRDSTPEEIEAAYRAGAAKYDEALVAQFPDGVRAHFKAKADAIEEAYRTLTALSPRSVEPV